MLGGPQGELGLLGSFMLGLSMGLTACTVTCLPFMGAWVLGRGKGQGAAMVDTWLFLGGRVLAYSVLGMLAGSLGAVLSRWLASGIGNASIGLASCVAGLWLLLPALRAVPGIYSTISPGARQRDACGVAGGRSDAPVVQPLRFVRDPVSRPVPPTERGASGCSAARRGVALPPFFLGVSLSLTPCAPLGWLLTVCALSGNALAGFGHGLAFGMGAAVTPLLLFLPLFGLLGSRLLEGRLWLSHWLGGGAGMVLVALGIKRLLLL
ncbi:sulfite exporter TauE/SafE family protein [Azoarcus sp. L1K30]|nr:sulfite exporter TauE/SafE family protein [Azoarcus sp. L1K30]